MTIQLINPLPPYYSQRDNLKEWWRTCNSSTMAMCVEFFKPGLISGDDEYINKLAAYGDTTDHSAHTRLLAEMGIESEWKTTLDYSDLDAQLADNKPIPIGVLHNGTLQYPTGGHICLVVGKYKEGYVCHDPWGHGFDYTDTNGNKALYPYQSLNVRWLVNKKNSGWGRIFYL